MGTSNKSGQFGPPRFTVAVHILVGLAQSDCFLSSAVIADQVNSHATFMRRVLATLAQSGLVEAREGRDGGYCLKVPAEQITLADVYSAVKCDGTEAMESGDAGDCGGEGKRLDEKLADILTEAELHTLEYLKKHTIADFI
ncbi:Rrf2 family transcriptional regulator [Cohnella endophytica]|uniref:Rrf2 family transcriptional regulator n=1 Tax=Cohnella endophytica TaxID=2419778 RepID=A0A494XVQ8_9BACL|nr:Rrf2 family transcriptional regulator [Cohnella endophytica]RKP51673.1 Rrf2 family transcriptional regulator [Cohnella endophytica]